MLQSHPNSSSTLHARWPRPRVLGTNFAFAGAYRYVDTPFHDFSHTLGIKLKVPDLSGKSHEVQIREVISPTYEHRIHGAGMPRPKTPDQFGDIIVRFAIQFPAHVKDSDKPILKQILSGQ